VRVRHSGIHEIDSCQIDTAGYERVAYGTRDGYEPCDATTVLQSASRNEWHSPRDDEGQRSPADEGGERDRVGTRIVRVYEIRIPCSEHRADAARRGEVPVAAHAHRCRGDACGAKTANERCVRRRDHERLVTVLTLPAREQVDLSLSTAPFSAGVQMQDAKRGRGGHAGRMDVVGPHRNRTGVGRVS
jgi:hypothetical protein